MATTIEGNVYVSGTLVPRRFTPPAGSITDAAIIDGADVDTDKVGKTYVITEALSDHAEDATTVRRELHRVYGATGAVAAFGVYVTVAAGAATTLTVDLLKNGSSILSSTFTVDNGDAAYALVEPAGYSSTALVAGDCLAVSVTLAGANEPRGVTAWLVVKEDPTP